MDLWGRSECIRHGPTLSETLHRAEETAVTQFASTLPAFDREDLAA